MTKEAFLRFTMVSFSGFKTVRSLNTTWNFARSITRVSTHEHEHWEDCLCTQSLLKKKVFGQLTLAVASPVHRRHGRHKVSIPECDLTGRLEERSTITLLPVGSHSGIDTFCTTVNLKRASFIIIMHLQPRLLSGESITLKTRQMTFIVHVNDLILILGGGVDGGVVEGEGCQASDCSSKLCFWFVSVKQLDVLDKAPWWDLRTSPVVFGHWFYNIICDTADYFGALTDDFIPQDKVQDRKTGEV